MAQAIAELQAVDFLNKDWISGSGIDEKFTKLNAAAVKNNNYIKRMLPNPQWDRGGGWIVRSLDPRTGGRAKHGQFKPMNPRDGEDGKSIKYETFPYGESWEPIFLNPTDEIWQDIADFYNIPLTPEDKKEIRRDRGFWAWVKKHPQIPIILTEGAKKAGVLLTYGYVAVCLPGVYGWKKKDVEEFTDLMGWLVENPRKFILAFDADIESNKNVATALTRLGEKLTATGCAVSVVNWDKSLAKGCDDYIVAKGIQAWEEVMSREWLFEQYIKHLEEIYNKPSAKPAAPKPTPSQTTKDKGEKENKSRFLQVQECIKQAYSGRVRFSDYGDIVYLDEKPVAKAADFFNRTYQMCCEILGFDATDKHVERALDIFLEDNRFNPVIEYLYSLKDRQSQGAIERLAIEGMGISSTFQRYLLRKQLIACVARAVEPGSKVDSVAVIFGAQGVRKTTLLEILGGDLYRHLDGETSDKDTRMIASQGWIIEWGEVESIFGKKAVSKVKSFITERKDNYRPPYGKKLDILNEARKYCLWGTTNEQELLADPTGTRRFWMIHQKKKIEIDFITGCRDDVWSEAYNAYLAGEPWWLTSDEEIWLEDNNREYLQASVWDEEVQDFLYAQAIEQWFTISDIFKRLGFDPNQKDQRKREQIRNSLLRAGCGNKRTTHCGISASWWWKTGKTHLPEITPWAVTGGVTGGVISETPVVEPKMTGDTQNQENIEINFPNPVIVPNLTPDDPDPFGEIESEKSEILVSCVTNPARKRLPAVTPLVTPPVTAQGVIIEEGVEIEIPPAKSLDDMFRDGTWHTMIDKLF